MHAFNETSRLSGQISLQPTAGLMYPAPCESVVTVAEVLNDEMAVGDLATYSMGPNRWYVAAPGTTAANFFYKPADRVIIAVTVSGRRRTIRWICTDTLTAADLARYQSVVAAL